MIYSIKTMKYIKKQSIPLSITTTALRTAQQFADQSLTPEKQEQVYFNTLAVCAVNDYMEMMDIPTDLNASDSWNPAMRLYSDVADLKLTALGHLECRPIRSGTSCYIPREVPDDRIGIVVVEINVGDREATLLGFTQTVRTGELSINELQTVDDLLARIDRLEHSQNEARIDRLEHSQSEVSLSQWLQNIFEAGWQSVEKILAPKTPSLAFRRCKVTRGKLIDIGIQLPGQSVALVVTLLTPETKVTVPLKVQVYPASEHAYLPPTLTLNLLDGKGVVVMEAIAGTANTHMTLEFHAQEGERFSVRVKLEDMSITENFVV
jgi:hypothetical protein